jgi:ABC-type polysaccharide transport system permease subunit
MNLHLIDSGINFLGSNQNVWLPMLGYATWKTLGWTAIIYLAVIVSIDQEQYEAAIVDGANRFQKIWHTTVPGVMPTFFVLLLLSIANFINNGMEQYYSGFDKEIQDKIMKTPLTIYVCEGEEKEIKEWYKTINIVGIAVNTQELLNATYSGPFVTLVKTEFSNSQNANIQK